MPTTYSGQMGPASKRGAAERLKMGPGAWDPRQAAIGTMPFRIAMGYGRGMPGNHRPSIVAPTSQKAAGASSLQEVQRSACARRRQVDASVAMRERSDKKAEDSDSEVEGKWHCDICGTSQTCPRPDAAVGRRYCGKCQRQWEAGWSLAKAQLAGTFGTMCEASGEVVGLCRKCGLPLGELAYEDEGGAATLHEECMAQLKMLEVQGKERAREEEVAEKKRKVREEHGIGWSITMVPCSWGLADKLGCRLSGKQSLCCLVLESSRSVRVVETAVPTASVNLEYLALALQVRLHEGREPLFSLDPVHQPKEPEKSTQVKHFDPEWLMGTTAGEVMFQADYHLKELSMGEYEQPVVGMRSMTDYSEEERAGQGWNAREWFTVRNAEICKSTDNVLIPRVEMSVEAREQHEGPNGWQDAKVTRQDHPLVKFAEDFTHNFDLIAERKSVVYHLRELAKASVLAKFLLDTQVELDEAWFNTVDWPVVKEAASKCSLEIPQLWNDRFHSQVRLHSGASLGKPDGVFTTLHSVYGGVSFGLDRFRVASTKPVAASLRAVTSVGAPMAGLMAQTFIGPQSTRHPGPRGVDLNLDKFSLDETVDTQIEVVAHPVVGKEFWSSLDGGKDSLSNADVLKQVFNPCLSDRRGEGELFVSPDTSAEYMRKLKQLIDEEAKVRQNRKDRFLCKDFSFSEPGALFPSSWCSSIKLGSGDRSGRERDLRPYTDKKLCLKDLKAMELVFDQSTEDGLRFRIYRRGSIEVRTTQPHGQEEVVGAAFTEGGEEASAEKRVQESELIRLMTQYVSAAAEPTPSGKMQEHRYWLLLETECDNLIVTEKLRSGQVAWHENSVDLANYAPHSRAVGSVSCARAGITVGDMKKHRSEHASSSSTSAAECKRYAEEVYSRAWAFASPQWQPGPGEACAPTADVDSGAVSAKAVHDGRLAALRRQAARAHADPKAVRAAVEADGLGLERAVEQLKEDREIVAAAVRENGGALKFASEKLRANRFIVRAAVEQDALAIRHATEALRADEEIARLAVAGNSYAIELVAERLRTTPGLILASLQRNEFALEHAPQALLADRAFVLAAVRRNGRALEQVPKKWRSDKSFMLEVVKGNGFTLKYASDALRADPAVVLAALAQDRRAVEHADLRALGLRPGDDVVAELQERLGMDTSDDGA